MRLHLYFARRFLYTFLAVFGAFFLILSLFDMLEQIRRFGEDGLGFDGLVSLTLLNVPKSIYRILPLITIIASIFLFLSLSRSSELVIARASGRSAVTALLAPVGVALLVGALAVTVMNPIVAATLKQYEVVADRYRNAGANVLSLSREGLWLRQGSPTGQTVVRAARANLNGTQILGASFFVFAPDGTPLRRIEADVARLVPGAWELSRAREWPLAGSANPERDAVSHDRLQIASDLTPAEILDSFGDPAAISIWDLPTFVKRLEEAGFSARIHRTFFQAELSLPLLMAAMVLAGAGFTMRHARAGRTSVLVLMALGFGFSLYFIRNLAIILGESGQIPILLAAWGPVVAALLLPLGLILHLEDG